jgi:hypothetical protein
MRVGIRQTISGLVLASILVSAAGWLSLDHLVAQRFR